MPMGKMIRDDLDLLKSQMILYTDFWIDYSVSNIHPFIRRVGSTYKLQQSSFGRNLWFENICTIAAMKMEFSHQCTLIIYMMRVQLVYVTLMRSIVTIYIKK